ncbi:DUF5810 domain-containing protein [Halorubrum sp. BV1]|uniref:DUF5810 domain-containing protein n=1 Tax=Halorubrum sp. BV1 TaxID=1498500 RepID=UPI00067901C5|nr:DUF5810 domain-containing protein [Halorubrum sp. BV1]
MGYACPVCETPQRDGEHLAHHLAFTALLHGDDHAAWLDERVPDWSDRDPDGLAAAVIPHADDAEYHEVFEDTADRGRPNVDDGAHPDPGHGDHAPANGGHSGHAHGSAASPGIVDESGATDPETAEALEKAREMTREMLADGLAGEDDDRDGDDRDDPTA